MKISEYYNKIADKQELKIFKKWIFWILLNEEAFFMAKHFNMKITKLDKENIKIWFPDSSKNKWLEILKNKNIWYILIERENDNFIEKQVNKWNHFSSIFKINIEDYLLTRDRILNLNKLNLEDKNEKNFLLKEKLEDIYMISSGLLMRLPKKERYYFREKFERLFMDLLEYVYKYMYNLEDRKVIIEKIFSVSIILREYFRFFYKIWVIKNDNVFIDLWDRWLEILKICKGIRNKI